jgi:shikimate kinase|tara:strand:- start:3161 stop:3679 length:519 start_codon:yes stop_codon:yes gene_type:complete
MKIVLLGYMASGKSTIGALLSKQLSFPFIDLDAYIESKEKNTINAIFKEKGEIYFRRIEHLYLTELLNSEEEFVLSLGGGTPCYANNIECILKADTTISFYLQASIALLVERLIKGKENRPLVKEIGDEKLVEYVAKHLFERRFFYEQAHHKIAIDQKETLEIVTAIKNQLH